MLTGDAAANREAETGARCFSVIEPDLSPDAARVRALNTQLIWS